MRGDTFRTWLEERGCRFEQHPRGKGGLGHVAVTVRRGPRSATLPLVGTTQDLDPEDVRDIVEALDLDPSELPGPQSRV